MTLTPTIPSFLDADFGYQNTEPGGRLRHGLERHQLERRAGSGEPGIPGVTVCLVNSAGSRRGLHDHGRQRQLHVLRRGAGQLHRGGDGRRQRAGRLHADQRPGRDPGHGGAPRDITDVDFGYVRNPATGAIGDTVWMDANRNGVQNGAEPGIANVTVQLYRDSDGTPGPSGGDTPVDTTATDIYGHYLFTGLPAGNYYVDVDQTTLPSGLAPTTGTTDPSAADQPEHGRDLSRRRLRLRLADGQRDGRLVWHDVDGNGIQDPGEPGIGGVTITVTGPSCPTGCTTTTGPDGSWLIAGSGAWQLRRRRDAAAGLHLPTDQLAARGDDHPGHPGRDDMLYADFGFDNGPTGVGRRSHLAGYGRRRRAGCRRAGHPRCDGEPGQRRPVSSSQRRRPMPPAATSSPACRTAPTPWWSPTSATSWPGCRRRATRISRAFLHDL